VTCSTLSTFFPILGRRFGAPVNTTGFADDLVTQLQFVSFVKFMQLFTVKERLSCTITSIVGTYHGPWAYYSEMFVNRQSKSTRADWFLSLSFFQERRAKGRLLKKTAHDFLQNSEFFRRNKSLVAEAAADESTRCRDATIYHWKNAGVVFIQFYWCGDMTDPSIVRPHNRGGLSILLLHQGVTTCPRLFRRVQLLTLPTSYAEGREPRHYAIKSNSPFHAQWF